MKSFRHQGISLPALIGATLAGFLLALLMAASPALHERLHHDADHDQHECLAKVLHAGGASDDAPAPPTLAAFVAELFEVAPVDASRVAEALFLDCGILEHAPPRRA
ncbi:MAG TPA: hypothetical protein VGO11_17810 [Chthoniobacteraceae bacterium]|jgi:hypothetical protein|nr:hypothetical protein [Chthoniobacteraceae bacterium]